MSEQVQFEHNPDYEPIDTGVLEAIPNPRPEADYTDQFVAQEFSTNCPVDYGVDPDDPDDEPDSQGVRDYGEIEIEYKPEDYIVELKTLKYYLASYETARVAHEEVAISVWEDLAGVLFPDMDREEAEERLFVKFNVNVRGGIKTDVWVGGVHE